MNYRFPLISLAVALGVALVVTKFRTKAAAQELPAAHRRLAINAGGLERHCLVHLPPLYDKAKPLPLVIMLHGMGGTAVNAVRETGWSAKADAESFIVAYPDASRPDATEPPNFKSNPQAWNDGSGRFHAAERKIDDVGFIRTLIERLATDYGIDQRRVFVTGFSNGASMAFRVGAELSERVAALAPTAGACWTETLKPTRGISLCYITGAADTLNPLEGGVPKLAFGGSEKGGVPKPAVSVTIQKWAKVLACPGMPNKDETTNGVRTCSYGPGRDGAEILFLTIDGLGHIWAGGENLAPEFMVGKPTDKLNATDVIWEFFKTHPAAL
jgi:polyhydroxybutyrate depolymerase